MCLSPCGQIRTNHSLPASFQSIAPNAVSLLELDTNTPLTHQHPRGESGIKVGGQRKKNQASKGYHWLVSWSDWRHHRIARPLVAGTQPNKWLVIIQSFFPAHQLPPGCHTWVNASQPTESPYNPPSPSAGHAERDNNNGDDDDDWLDQRRIDFLLFANLQKIV